MAAETKFEKGLFSLKLDGQLHQYKACIFDFDGTILDTERYHYLTWNTIFEPYGVHITEEEYIPLKSSGREHIIDVICESHHITLSEEQYAKAVKDKGSIYLDLAKDISEKDILPGVVDFVIRLRENGIKTAIASSGKNLHYMLKRFDLGKYFDAIVDGNGSGRPKPAPDIFNEAAGLIGVDAKNAIVFEDSPPGLQGAHAGGYDAIGIGGIRCDTALLCLDNYLKLL